MLHIKIFVDQIVVTLNESTLIPQFGQTRTISHQKLFIPPHYLAFLREFCILNLIEYSEEDSPRRPGLK